MQSAGSGEPFPMLNVPSGHARGVWRPSCVWESGARPPLSPPHDSTPGVHEQAARLHGASGVWEAAMMSSSSGPPPPPRRPGRRAEALARRAVPFQHAGLLRRSSGRARSSGTTARTRGRRWWRAWRWRRSLGVDTRHAWPGGSSPASGSKVRGSAAPPGRMQQHGSRSHPPPRDSDAEQRRSTTGPLDVLRPPSMQASLQPTKSE